jgi:hypothetical protein
MRATPDGGVANTQPDFDCAKTLFDSYITVRSRSDRLNANAVTDDRVTRLAAHAWPSDLGGDDFAEERSQATGHTPLTSAADRASIVRTKV